MRLNCHNIPFSSIQFDSVERNRIRKEVIWLDTDRAFVVNRPDDEEQPKKVDVFWASCAGQFPVAGRLLRSRASLASWRAGGHQKAFYLKDLFRNSLNIIREVRRSVHTHTHTHVCTQFCFCHYMLGDIKQAMDACKIHC